jgi:hypothetical protein
MSKDDKAGAAAAQLLIDDEPDDWCAGPVPQDRKRGANASLQGQENIQHRMRRYAASQYL